MRIGLIDLGTNSIKFFVYDLIEFQPPEIIYQEKHMIRLGDGLFLSGKIGSAAIKRLIKALNSISKSEPFTKLDHFVATSTCALREARNRKAVLRKVCKKTGIKFKVISGQLEAELIAIGVKNFIQLPKQKRLLVDIGGGSTEISIWNGKRFTKSKSLPLGAARCQQIYLKTTPSAPDHQTKLRMRVQQLLKSNFRKTNIPNLIGTSGSIGAISKLYNARNKQPQPTFPRNFVRKLVIETINLNKSELITFGLSKKRADIFIPALIVLNEIMSYFSVSKISWTKAALREGLLHKEWDRVRAKKSKLNR